MIKKQWNTEWILPDQPQWPKLGRKDALMSPASGKQNYARWLINRECDPSWYERNFETKWGRTKELNTTNKSHRKGQIRTRNAYATSYKALECRLKPKQNAEHTNLVNSVENLIFLCAAKYVDLCNQNLGTKGSTLVLSAESSRMDADECCHYHQVFY